MTTTRTMRLRNFIIETLESNGPMTTGEILFAFNQKYRHGTNMNIIGNVLPCVAQRVGFYNETTGRRTRWALWGPKGEE